MEEFELVGEMLLVYKPLFEKTRELEKVVGNDCEEFTNILQLMLNIMMERFDITIEGYRDEFINIILDYANGDVKKIDITLDRLQSLVNEYNLCKQQKQ